jgi:hypothetical protein
MRRKRVDFSSPVCWVLADVEKLYRREAWERRQSLPAGFQPIAGRQGGLRS